MKEEDLELHEVKERLKLHFGSTSLDAVIDAIALIVEEDLKDYLQHNRADLASHCIEAALNHLQDASLYYASLKWEAWQ